MNGPSENAQVGSSRGGFASMPYDSAFTAIVEKMKVQVFLFALAVSILLLALAMIWGDSAAGATPLIIAGGIVGLSLLAMIVYFLTHARKRTGTDARLRHQEPLAPTAIENDRRPLGSDSNLSYDEFRYSKSVSTTRAALLLGAILYAAYYFLDAETVRDSENLNKIFLIRVTVCCASLLSWPLTFTSLFQRLEAKIITALCLLAGFGILGMIAVGGPDYYYEGLTLVIMFGAFVFGLPSRHLILLCGTLILGYSLVTLRSWPLSPVLANNYFLLTAATLIAIAANRVLNRMSREVFVEALATANAKRRQAAFFRLAAERLSQLHEELKEEGNLTSDGSPPAHQRLLARFGRDVGSIRDDLNQYLEAS